MGDVQYQEEEGVEINGNPMPSKVMMNLNRFENIIKENFNKTASKEDWKEDCVRRNVLIEKLQERIGI